MNITDPVGQAALLLAIPAVLFWLAEHTRAAAFFRRVPVLIFAYFVPALLSNFGVLPESSPAYDWIRAYILPASLLLLTLSVDLPGVLRLGPKAIIMFLTATAGVVIGGPIAYLMWSAWLPQDIWMGMAALSGSWIGGGANFVAIGQSVGATDTMMGMMVIVDVLVGYSWTAVLMYLATQSDFFDRKLQADTSAIDELKHRIQAFQDKTTRVAGTGDLMMLLALALGGSWLADVGSKLLPPIGDFINAFSWKIILVTTVGIVLSYTKFREYEGVGASKLGTVFLYVIIGTIGAGADVTKVVEYPMLVVMAVTWILIHIGLLVLVAKWIKAPLFFLAVGSQANIGGVASAPVVASVFHPSLAVVGVLLGVLGYVLGTYAGLLCAAVLRMLAG